MSFELCIYIYIYIYIYISFSKQKFFLMTIDKILRRIHYFFQSRKPLNIFTKRSSMFETFLNMRANLSHKRVFFMATYHQLISFFLKIHKKSWLKTNGCFHKNLCDGCKYFSEFL